MRIKAIERVCIAVALLATPCAALAENVGFDTEGIQEFLHRSCDGKNAGMVIGVVDEHGTQVFGAGKLDNGTDDEVNGDTLFEIGSITKTFTVLLLEDMVNRGEMKLDDPVEKYLPESVKVPSRGGKKITLLNLAAQDSGLPHDGTNMVRRIPNNMFADYTADNLYEFLSSYTLTQDPAQDSAIPTPGSRCSGTRLNGKRGAILSRSCANGFALRCTWIARTFRSRPN